MVQLGERFLYGCEIAGSLFIGVIFIYYALTSPQDFAWRYVIAAVLCFSVGLFFGLMYFNTKKEREKKMI